MNLKFRNRIFYVIFGGAILLLAGCNKQAEPLNYINIEDQYELKLHQKLSETGGLPSLQISTLRSYECLNSYISHSSIITNKKIEVYLNDILREGDCISGNDIVSEEILINTDNTAIPIKIILKNAVTNEGTLYSNNSEFELILDKFDGLKISKTHINIVHPKMIWGSFNLSNNEVNVLITQYLASMDLNIPEVKGDYGHFYIAQDESITIYGNEFENQLSFLISTDESFENFKTKIQEFKLLDPSLVFQATNYDGSALNIH